MTHRDKAPVGAPCWLDLMTTDADATRRFYSELLGWEPLEQSAEFGGYFMWANQGVPVAGGVGAESGQPASRYWSVYLASDDAEKTAEIAASTGAQVIVPPTRVGDVGVMAVLIDPTGAQIGVWQPIEFPGFTELGVPGTPGWFELLTRDYERAVEFYREVFGWDARVMSDTPEFRYTTLGEGEHALAGIMDAAGSLAADEDPHWSAYFIVSDTDATVSTAKKLGGRVLFEAQDTPYGRMARLVDAGGSQFQVMGPTSG